MVTRKRLFEDFSHENGDSFYVAHNNASYCTAFQLLENLVGLPSSSTFQTGSIFDIQTRPVELVFESSQLALTPAELFPHTYLRYELKGLEVSILERFYFIPAEKQIRKELIKYFVWSDLKQLLLQKQLTYKIVLDKMNPVVGFEFSKQEFKIPYKMEKSKKVPLVKLENSLFQAAGGQAGLDAIMKVAESQNLKIIRNDLVQRRNRRFTINYTNFIDKEVIEQFDEGKHQNTYGPESDKILQLIKRQILNDFKKHQRYYKKDKNKDEWYIGTHLVFGKRGPGITIGKKNEIFEVKIIWQLSWILNFDLTKIVGKKDYMKLIDTESEKSAGQKNPDASSRTRIRADEDNIEKKTSEGKESDENNNEEEQEENNNNNEEEQKVAEIINLDDIPDAEVINKIIEKVKEKLSKYEKGKTPATVWKEKLNGCRLEEKIAFKQYLLQQHNFKAYERVQYADISDVLKNCTI